MPIFPKVNQTIRDGELGAVNLTSSNVAAFVGISEKGPVNEPRKFNSASELVATFGNGPLAEAASFALIHGKAPVVACRATTATLPTTSAVVKTAAGAGSDSTMSVTGDALDSYLARVEILTGGEVPSGAVRFRFSLDDGRTWSADTVLPSSGSYAIANSGLTLQFSVALNAESLLAGDVFTFSTTAGKWAASGLYEATGGGAINALLDSTIPYAFVVVVGKCSRAEADTIATAAGAAEAAFRYVRFMCHARGQESTDADAAAWRTAVLSDFASFVHARVSVCAGECRATSPLSGRQYRRPSLWPAAARAVRSAFWIDLARVKDGPLPAVSITDELDKAVDHDERVTPAFDDARFVSLRTFIGRPGVYVTNPNIMGSAGSDFDLWQLGRVMDIACATTHRVLSEQLSDAPLLNPSTGFIREQDARAIESAANSALRDALVSNGAASGAQAIVSRTDNIASTKTVNVTTRVLPRGYIKAIENDIGFTNPALEV